MEELFELADVGTTAQIESLQRNEEGPLQGPL